MHYDIYILHSYKDNELVDSLIDFLSLVIPGIQIWRDVDEAILEEYYRTYISSAIDDSKIMLFVLSDNSLANEYCEFGMLNSKSKKKKIIPYLLPEMEPKGWFELEFGKVKCIYSTNKDDLAQMIRRIKVILGRFKEPKEIHKKDIFKKDKSNPTFSISSQFYFDPAIGELKYKGSIEHNPISRSEILMINGHEYIDLGLPSGLKWATCNLGASRPEEYGDGFSWGDVDVKELYLEDTTETSDKDNLWLKEHGFIQDNGNLTLFHDAARHNWGGTWRMPTKEEIEELIANTTSQWAFLKGVPGVLVMSKKNNNSIFLPAAGWFIHKSREVDCRYGSYWSSITTEDTENEAYSLDISKKEFNLSSKSFRDFGMSIRPVSE